MTQLEDLRTPRIVRILTTDFPQYFAIVTRIKQDVHVVGPDACMVTTTSNDNVQAFFPAGALTKKIKVGLQVCLRCLAMTTADHRQLFYFFTR